jgi:hypothetical protein
MRAHQSTPRHLAAGSLGVVLALYRRPELEAQFEPLELRPPNAGVGGPRVRAPPERAA